MPLFGFASRGALVSDMSMTQTPSRLALLGGPQRSTETAVCVPGRFVRPGADRSRLGRRSDDGQMILQRVRLWLEHTTEQVLVNRQGQFEPPAFSLLRVRKFDQGNPAVIDERQTGPR
jgi:hypothetical protein